MTVYITKSGERVPETLAKELKKRKNVIQFTKYHQNPITEKWSEMKVIDKVVGKVTISDTLAEATWGKEACYSR